MSFTDDFTTYHTNTCWPDGTVEGNWVVQYAGYGCTEVVLDAAGVHWWQQRPQASTSSGVTHAGLATSPIETAPFTFSVEMKTVAQLRTGSAPNPWEVGWVLWCYTDDNHFYSLNLKPNGWELGKEDPAYPGAQRYLATGSSPTFPIGQIYTVSVTMDTSATMTVSVNGKVLVTFKDTERPYLAGGVGLYCEDSQVQFTHAVVSTSTPPPPPPPPPPPSGMRVITSPLYGATIDNASAVSSALAAAQHAARKMTTRIVFDVSAAVADYKQMVTQLQPVSYLMGLLLDSSEVTSISAAAEHARVAQYLAAYGSLVDIWEIGNEVNGNWQGAYTDVATKVIDAYNQVKTLGKGKTALTLYYNINCGDGPGEPDPIAFTNKYIPATMRNGLDYVLLSYYEANCNNIRPTAATWTAYFEKLHALYPNALLGFGEVGLPNAVTGSTLTSAEGLLKYYYGLTIPLSYYIGGYFWWCYTEDMLPYTTKPMWSVWNAAIQAY